MSTTAAAATTATATNVVGVHAGVKAEIKLASIRLFAASLCGPN